MKIVLIEPQGKKNLTVYASGTVHIEPFGLEYIGAVLNQAGHSVEIIQQGDLTEHQLVKQIYAYDPEVVGFSCMTYNYNTALRFAKLIKSQNPKSYTVFGGYHATSVPEVVCEEAIDFAVIGEGEYSFLDLVETLSSGGDISKVQGIAYLNNWMGVTRRERIKNLDKLPFPLRNPEAINGFKSTSLHFPSSKIRGPTIQLTYSRGCPYACPYCNSEKLWRRQVIWRSPGNVVKEIAMLKEEFGIKHFFFTDLTFNVDRGKIYALCREIRKQNLGIYWFCQCRADGNLDKTLLETMRDAGCEKIHFGVEACSDVSLQKIERKQSLQEIEHIIKLTSSLGIIVKAYLMIGYPWDDKDSLENISKRVKSLPIDELRITFLTPFPGTPLFEEYKRQGLLLSGNFECYTTDEPIIKNSNNMTPEELVATRKQIAKDFYTSKEYEKRRGEKIAKFPHLRGSFDEFFEFLHSKAVLE